MSERKKVIYVKDLVIKAENVRIEPSRPKPRPRPPFDPFFGPPRRQQIDESVDEVDVVDEDESSDED